MLYATFYILCMCCCNKLNKNHVPLSYLFDFVFFLSVDLIDQALLYSQYTYTVINVQIILSNEA